MTKRIDGFNFEPPKLVTAERVINGNQMTEICKNENGQVRKISVFMDRNGDGKFEQNEIVSVKYIETESMSQQSVEYRDTNGDGFCDEVVNSDWTGNEVVNKQEPDNIHGKNHRMDFKYGFKWDSTGPMYVLENKN